MTRDRARTLERDLALEWDAQEALQWDAQRLPTARPVSRENASAPAATQPPRLPAQPSGTRRHIKAKPQDLPRRLKMTAFALAALFTIGALVTLLISLASP